MTEREKIIEVIKQASEQAYADFHELFREGVKRVRDGEISRFTNRDVRPTHDEILADKLIEAGYGNVADWKRRAEVAERALRNVTERASCNICDNFSCRYYEGINYDYNAEECIKWWLVQAEKELAEEG